MLAMMERPAFGMTDERVEWHLWNWERWQFRGGKPRLKLPARASGGIGRSHRLDFDEMVERVDARCARAVNAIVWHDLSEPQKTAVLYEHGVILMHGLKDLLASYDAACERIRRELMRRGID